MRNIYYYKTIDECEKEISSKVIDIDIKFAANYALFECFTRTIKTIAVWFMVISSIYISVTKGWLPCLKSIGIFCGIYIIGFLLISWVKVNYDHSYTNIKINTVRNMIESCEEYQKLLESECEEWQKRQTLRKMAMHGNLDVTWDKDE